MNYMRSVQILEREREKKVIITKLIKEYKQIQEQLNIYISFNLTLKITSITL
jgi:hypothetical protein